MKIRKCKYNFGNNNDGVFSTINGYATETNNFGETAVGILNKSTLDPDTFTSPDVVTSSKATLFSVGNGSDNVRKNAFEIKANGDTYINGVGGYDGTNSEDATSVGESIQSVQDSSNKVAEDIESIHIEKSGIGNTYVLKVAGEDRGTITDESGVSFTPGDGLQLVDTDLSVKIDSTSESYLTAGQDGLKISGIDAKFGNYLPLSGGTVEYLNIGDYSMRSTGLLYTNSFNITKNGISDFNNPILTIDANNEPSIKMYGNGNYATIHLGYDNTGTNYGAKGVTIQGKTKQDLLNAAGSTTPISNIATQVQAAIVDSAPETLDTLNELAAALGDDPNFATTVTNQIAQKADKTTATTSADGLMSAADKQKLDSIEISTLATKEELNDYCPLDGGFILSNLAEHYPRYASVGGIYTSLKLNDNVFQGIFSVIHTSSGKYPLFQNAPKEFNVVSSDDLLIHKRDRLDKSEKEYGECGAYLVVHKGFMSVPGYDPGDYGDTTGLYLGVCNSKSPNDSKIIKYGIFGVTIKDKTSSDLLHAAGGTISIEELKSQLNIPDTSTLQDAIGTNVYTGANYISKETNLTEAVLQLDEEIKATNDNLALEHANAEATYVKKTGDTITGDITVSGRKHIVFEGDNVAADNRRLRINYGSIDVLARRNPEGWADNLFDIYNETGDTRIATALGAYGMGDQLQYLYIGGTYNNPKVVVTRDGKLGVGQNYASEMLEVNGNAKATKFIGPLQGNADTATKATQDANGDIIADTYVKKTQLKTINSQSLLGEGNIEIQVEGGGITDAPSDNKLYGRKNAQWTEVTVPEVEVPTKVSQLTNDSGFQTEAQVSAKISALVDSAPETLDTLNELAAALGDDPNFATTITTQLGNKLDTSTYNSDKATFALKSELPSVESITTTDINALFS